jgi:hypothetical protein
MTIPTETVTTTIRVNSFDQLFEEIDRFKEYMPDAVITKVICTLIQKPERYEAELVYKRKPAE